ncbi:MAG: glycosyltransferase family 2 protein [Candidatus Omnitrophica bacterium]|nr:glycosyltransferase family 2 protein [Candidatus Omnitrophota bacterium]
MPKLSIVVLTFDSSKLIESCLESIFKQDYQDFEVILVDNGSRDNTVSLVKEDYAEVKLIGNKKNLGACRGRNQGIEVAQGEWILTLDCDIVLEKDFLSKIIRFTEESEKSIGMIQPKILMKDKKTIYSCGIYLSKLLRRFYDIGKDKIDNGQFNAQKYIFGACCAAALYRRQVLEEIKEKTGYFDERFFFLVEDVDLAWRAQRKGYRALYVSEAVCYHLGNSSGLDFKLRQYLCFRNRYYTIMKNEGFANLPKSFLSILIYDLPRLFYLFFTNTYTLRGIKRDFKLPC